ncbi:ergothioneine biosynthesis glutamate--cysteine ligase EgtA [Streptomyces sp. GC420]|uniref:ergothioneine biosynthesis glutamate--cysteine ligase EgtA n=1 Tax=Streptomyces sp. GC420 TaxID=2697568 RepID=UPI0014150220|nr:ergothioneine biosynthesis glutamate--cysteine ligase EgtA [Streptomyces sp. GC420]NBM15482.1 ergothioneine biosynthesis glutamate--cysteine ligase EgtA [Streptomyces sp. GC420]
MKNGGCAEAALAGAEAGKAISEEEAEALIRGICFKTGPPGVIGVELEWLVHDLDRPEQPVPLHRLEAAFAELRELPLGSPLTFEPGGQLEISSLPASSLMECVEATSADLRLVRTALRERGLRPAGLGEDPWRSPRRFLLQPRYAAMEAYFDRHGPAGREMMCNSASVQVCLDAGHEEPGPLGHARRWRLAHLLGAVFVAAFANSPLRGGRPTGWLSTRQAHWASIDTHRSLAPAEGADPRESWVAHVLDTPVMCVRSPEGPWTVPRKGLMLRDWTRDGHGLHRPPTREDVEYHITTLFPPVRPRGHLELRMIDAQPGEDGWIVPLAVAAALFEDPAATETAYRAVKPLAELAGPGPAPRNPLWLSAARVGLAAPGLLEAARVCFAAAVEALPRLGASTAVRDAVGAYTERFVERGLCPADELLRTVSRNAGGPGAPGTSGEPGIFGTHGERNRT